MPRRLWTTDDFQRWASASGLSAPQLAVVLDVSERTAKRLRVGEVGVKDRMTERAQEWLRQSLTTTGRDAELLDSYAAQADWADLCAAFPLAHLTGVQSAIARGWTSANSHGFRQLSQPERMRMPKTWGEYDLEWLPGVDLPWGVEVRQDTDGRPYRVASAERTLIELAINESLFGVDDVAEAYKGAFHLAEARPDASLLMTKARERGQTAAEQVTYYVRHYL